MKFILKYHNDGKGKSQSHEVYTEIDMGYGPMNSGISTGYGATYEEAWNEHMNFLREHITQLQTMEEKLLLKEVEPIKVDCQGNPSKSK